MGPAETRKLDEITVARYWVKAGGNTHFCDPSRDDIQQALDGGVLEDRGFQSHLKELEAEWHQAQDVGALVGAVKSYHARRVAWFVEHGWDDAITINPSGEIKDGLHRLHAAKFLGDEKIAVLVEG